MPTVTWLLSLFPKKEQHLASAPQKPTATVAPAASAQPDGGPYGQGIAQLRQTAKWMTGALAAVASVMVAGSQLSSLGKLTWNDDTPRLLAAILAVAGSVLAVAVAIYLLTQAQMPGDSNMQTLTKAAKDPKSRLAKATKDDLSFTRGRPDIATLLKDLSSARGTFYERKARLAQAEEGLLKADDKDRATAEAERDKASKSLALAETQLDDLRKGQSALSELDVYLRIRQRFARTSPIILVCALLAAGGFIVFAWAANPPDQTAAGDALAQRPSMARLVLDTGRAKSLEATLGVGCARAATRPSGIPVIALSANEDQIEIVTIATKRCSEPKRLTVTTSEVTAAVAVSPG